MVILQHKSANVPEWFLVTVLNFSTSINSTPQPCFLHCLPLRMCSESAEEAKFATLQEYVPESAAEAIAK